MDNAITFFSGISVATFFASGVFFYKFYRTSRDKFYLLFCLTCWMFAIERIAILVFIGPSQTNSETAPWVYTIRLFAFLLIFFAFIEKNRKRR